MNKCGSYESGYCRGDDRICHCRGDYEKCVFTQSKEEPKCSCYRERTYFDFESEYKTQPICLGTKEQDECTCGGDPAKCDFYPEKREAAKKEEIKPTTIYYAHHQWKYGTKIEEYELDLIKRYFPHGVIFNPATELNVNGRTEEDIMNECLEIVDKSDIVIFSAMDGMIGIGVYNEVMAAKEAGKLVLYICQNKLTTDFRIYRTPERNSDRLYADIYADMNID